jgi:hypothetical protein
MGQALADLLQSAIQERINNDDTEEETRDDIVGLITEGSGVQEGTIENILNADIKCPPEPRWSPLADDLPVTVEEVEDALEEDGCIEQASKSADSGEPAYSDLLDKYN